MRKKVLIIQTAFIGDAILVSSLLESIHQEYPDCHIDLLVRHGNESLYQNHPFLKKLWVWNKKRNKYRNLLKLASSIRKEGYDQVINVQRFAASGILTLLSGAKFTVGFSKNPLSIFFSKRVPHIIDWEGSTNEHEIDRNFRLIEHLGIEELKKPKLYPSKEQVEKAINHQPSENYICIAPASVWFTKQFPVSKWTEFIDSLPENLHVILLGSPADQVLCDGIVSASTHNRIQNLAGELDLLSSAALMKGAVMNYVNDSAPLHLCSAMNAPVSAVFCSTVPAFGFGPLSDDSHIIEVRESLSCRPCGLHGYKSCPKGHFKCAINIDKEQLTSTLKK